jgi:hypothetical protein
MVDILSSVRIEQVSKQIMKNIGLGNELSFYYNTGNVKSIRRKAVRALHDEISHECSRGEAIAPANSIITEIIEAIEAGEKEPTKLANTYKSIKDAIYIHQSSFVNSDGLVLDLKAKYNGQLSERANRKVETKRNRQLTDGAAYLMSKYYVTPELIAKTRKIKSAEIILEEAEA